ncbi:DNA-methyltransferase [Natranaerobius thermophilus]|uniref:Methyltransferase n=1 Tax=Natranaerobius thermophilus (strain ATCC BAA-1301 / DSM 18059 / JW/NM-WN-LF) TaxID=457570 RepID=B2A7H6_NATTJ|nr:site-specific DNA-methyltransferase [Natranaerobius thermophilus]ACB85685.1 DNA methylase N-4/N-6 domain protein [Natranaerobius thermophilus JW/NM-WN-LF]
MKDKAFHINGETSENYKKIFIPINKNELTKSEKRGLRQINDAFSNDDLIIETYDHKLIVFLNKLDVNSLKDLIFQFVSEQVSEDNVLLALLTKIENIKSYTYQGGKKVFVNFNDERKVKDRKAKETQRGKFFYAQDADFKVTNNAVPKEYENQIICADSEQLLSKMPENCIDLVFTSPPYNFGLEYDNHQDAMNWSIYFDKLYRILDECIRVTKYGGRIIVNVQPLFSDYIPIHHFISNFFIKKKLIWKAEILWEKNNYNCKYTAWGSWKSPSNPYMKYTWEFLEVFCKGTMKKQGKKENIDISAEEFKEWVYGKWSIAPEKNMKNYKHPSMFPEELARRVMKLFSYQGDIILDPFVGSGTTPVVAHQNNRRFLGIDISREYCELARKRIDQQDC